MPFVEQVRTPIKLPGLSLIWGIYTWICSLVWCCYCIFSRPFAIEKKSPEMDRDLHRIPSFFRRRFFLRTAVVATVGISGLVIFNVITNLMAASFETTFKVAIGNDSKKENDAASFSPLSDARGGDPPSPTIHVYLSNPDLDPPDARSPVRELDAVVLTDKMVNTEEREPSKLSTTATEV